MSTSNKLQNLMNVCEDAVEFYTDATAKTDDMAKKMLFREMADIRKAVIVDIRSFMLTHDMEPKEASETMGGRVNKFIGETMASWSDDKDKELISYLEEAEDRCLHTFEDVANDNGISAEARAFVEEKLPVIQKTHDAMKILKDTVKQID